MMSIVIRGNEDFVLDPAPPNIEAEIEQNVRVLLATHQYEIPLARQMGLNTDYYGKPLPVAETLLYQSISDAIEEYEPRAEIVSISFEFDNTNGVTIPIVEVETADG